MGAADEAARAGESGRARKYELQPLLNTLSPPGVKVKTMNETDSTHTHTHTHNRPMKGRECLSSQEDKPRQPLDGLARWQLCGCSYYLHVHSLNLFWWGGKNCARIYYKLTGMVLSTNKSR